jgi:hypothetical protein
MDGSHVEVVFESTGAITDIQIDEENDRIFWASSATNRKQNSMIFAANLDGSSKQALYSGNLEYVLDIKHISLYLTEEHLYFSWGVWGGDIIRVDKWGLNYEKTGIFTVKLQITKDGKKDSVIKKDLVESYMSGNISGTLSANLSPYHIRESLVVSSRLNIEPGVIFIFKDSDQVGIDLSGELIAKGVIRWTKLQDPH